MDLIKKEYIREYQKKYQTEYYIKYKDYIAEKNKIYYEIMACLYIRIMYNECIRKV